MIVATYQRTINHPKAKLRRDAMRAAGICINSSYSTPKADGTPRTPPKFSRPLVEHGPVVKAGKCQRCIDVHKGKS